MLKYGIIVILIVILGFLQYRLWFESNGVQTTIAIKKSIADQQKQNQHMAKRNQELMAEVSDLKHGTQAIEERARDELGMIKNGEQFYQIAKPSDNNQSQPNS
jgi:cell division protein FtsB